MLNRLFGRQPVDPAVTGSPAATSSSARSRRSFPTIEGSLFVSSGSDPSSQKCIYLNCKATLREAAEPFSYELVVSRDEEEEEVSETLYPADLAFPIKQSAKFKADEERLGWSDRGGMRYDLDFEEDAPTEPFLTALSRALYENSNKVTSESASDDELRALLRPVEAPRPTDLLAAVGELLRSEGEFYHYDQKTETFVSVCSNVIATINSAVTKEDNTRAYLLMLFDKQSGKRILEHEISNDMMPQFYSQSLSLVWIMVTDPDADSEDEDDASQLCLSVKLNSPEDFVKFRNQFSVCLFEVNHQASMDELKIKPADRPYLEDTIRDDIEPMDVDDDVSVEDVEETRQIRDEAPNARASMEAWDDGALNSQLAIAYNNDRTFVVRGNKMGVFKTADDGASYQTMVSFKDPSGNDSTFHPSRILLHEQDTSMIVLDKDDPTRVMRMDLERGEIVDTWKGDATMNASINSVQKSEKYSNLTHKQDFVALNKNQLFRMDPRTTEFIVQSKKYAAGTRARMECVATTGAGYLAVASEKGDIRLFDQIGKNAKTHLPGLGDKIIGIDVTEDGSFVLATTSKYLLIIDTRVQGQAKGGFLKSMGKDKPPPRKLCIKPQDIAKHRMGEIDFTAAHFNTGSSLERSIVTSTGPFIVTWNFRAVKMGKLDSYQIKRYRDNIVADDFAYNNDGRIVVTLPNDVSIARR